MTKKELHTQVLTQVNELFETQPKLSKVFKESLIKIIDTNLKPKAGGGSVQNPPKMIDGVMNYYCRFHERYEPEHDMVMSQGKAKGYCKASISLWNKTQSNIKKLETQAVEFITSGNMEEAQESAKQAQELKDVLNAPSYYDYERDWLAFGGHSEAPVKSTNEDDETLPFA